MVMRARLVPASAAAAVALLAATAAPAATPTAATPTGAALLVSSGAPACNAATARLGPALGREGYAVQLLADPSAIAIRGAIDGLAGGSLAGGNAQGTTLIYVCAGGYADGARLFVLPPVAGQSGPVQPETEGVVLQALLNALAPTGGTLYADLDFPPGQSARPFVPRLASGVHLALAATAATQPAAIGQALARSAALHPVSDWPVTAATLRAAPGLPATTAFFPALPPPTPAAPPPVAPAPSTTTTKPAPPASPAAAAPTAAKPPPAAAAPKPARTPAAPDRSRHHARSPSHRAALPPPNPRIARIQQALARHGLYNGPSDGVLTEPTAAAIRRFQQSIGNAPTGTLNQIEIVRLLNS